MNQSNSYKKFARYLFWYLALFFIINVTVWKFGTEVLLTSRYGGGDLARMSYLLSMKEFTRKVDDLPKKHLELKDFVGQRIDVLTIGDSFSNGGGDGRNSYYQDYIATINNLTVMNVYPYPSDDTIMGFAPATTLAVLVNSGYLDLVKPRYVLIQSAERYSVPRFAPPLNMGFTVSLEELKSYYADKSFSVNILPPVSFINEGNFKFIYYNFVYNFSDHGFRRLVHKKRLSKPLFSVNDGKTLLFHGDDLQAIQLSTTQTVKLLNDNLNSISDMLASKGIELVFMPVVDKYTLYSDFIVNNKLPKSRFFEELRNLPRRYRLIDTKEILMERLRAGEKDIYRADDTHWSWRASQAVFEKERFISGSRYPERKGE